MIFLLLLLIHRGGAIFDWFIHLPYIQQIVYHPVWKATFSRLRLFSQVSLSRGRKQQQSAENARAKDIETQIVIKRIIFVVFIAMYLGVFIWSFFSVKENRGWFPQ